MARRRFLSQLFGLPFLALGVKAQEAKKPLKIMMRSSWGTDDPTRASFVFAHALVLSEAGHDVQIFLTADATFLMRKATADVIVPIGGRPSVNCERKLSPSTSPSFLVEPAPALAALPRLISPTGAPNTAIPLFLFLSSSGPIASWPNNPERRKILLESTP